MFSQFKRAIRLASLFKRKSRSLCKFLSIFVSMLKTSAILLAFALCATAVMGQTTLDYQGKSFRYTLLLDSALSADSVNYSCAVKSITIYALSGEKVQTIQPPENGSTCSLPKDQVFIVEDVNFDGNEDIRLLQFLPAGPNLPYFYWTYDSLTRHFKREEALEAITSPNFDPARRLITSFWRSSCCDHGLSVYRYINGKPVLIEESEVAQDENDNKKYITTLKKRIRGKMTLVKRTVEIDKEGN
jgi:hypothetical protein